MQKASALMGAIALLGKGVTDIGEGKAKKDHRYTMADLKRHEALMAKYKYRQQDLIESTEESINKTDSVNKVTTHQLDLQRDFAQHLYGN